MGNISIFETSIYLLVVKCHVGINALSQSVDFGNNAIKTCFHKCE